jgi:hypothetical protein
MKVGPLLPTLWKITNNIREYYKQLHGNTLDDQDVMNNLPDTYKLMKLI